MPTKRGKSETAGLLVVLSMCFCVAFTEVRAQSAAVDQKHSAAQQAMDRADMLRADWTQASLREAIDLYEKAALIWTSSSEFASASQATLKSGDIYFLFSEYDEALKRYQKTESLAGRTGDWLVKATALSRIGRLQSVLGNNELAQRQLAKALDLFKQHETNRTDIVANAYGEALSNLAEVAYAKGDFVKAREQFKSALEAFRKDRRGEAKVHLFNGYIAGTIGDLEKAVNEINQALEFYHEVNDKLGEGLALTALGLPHSLKRETDRATELHNKAIDIFRAIGDRYSEATALNALGQLYEGVHEYTLARSKYEQALQLFEEIKSVDGISATTCKVGRMHNFSKHPDQALPFYERCLQLSRAAGKRRTEVMALTEIAQVYASQNRPELALQQYQRVRKFYEAIGDLRGQATAWNGYGDTLLQFGQNERALEAGHHTLPLSEKSGDRGVLISTLYNLARANLALGSPEVALSFIRQSLEIIEDLRATVASPDFRVSYFSGVRQHYALCIEILMQLERLHPGHGFAADALVMSERGRARLLLDLINESRANLRQGAAEPLLMRERELRALFGRRAQYRMDLVLSRKDSAEIAAIDDQLAQLKAKYQQVQAEIRQQNPHLLSLEQSAPLNLQQIQNVLRDSDTILLEYALGNERSYLWAITSDSIQWYELPPRKNIEDTARELYRLITARQGRDGQTAENYQSEVKAAEEAYPEKAAYLSQMLLGPLAEQLGSKRLVIVTEGTLQHIPLDALPIPQIASEGTSGTLLIERNEVVVLPSVSTLIAIRSPRNRTSSPSKLVAVIADPVFSNSDDRVQREAGSRGIALASSDANAPEDRTRNGQLPRLTYASEEADAISAVAPWGTTLVIKGFDANRETAMSPDVGQYQILHFATHGFLDSDHPELSGIVLSSVDQNGNTTNGLMPLHDIYSLDLSAELTVLSACQTALGKDIKGEGLIGLTHSFMSAGSNAVVASLWKVDDEATALLMSDFYKSMLQQDMPPSAALRAAKLKLMKERQWRAPYYWAGFVLQGEYTNHIVVARHPWLRTGLVLLVLLILVVAAPLVIKKRKREPSPAQST
jgi:CHAT domain-containing protein/tetratricopeptide (TPR) repeat protein